MDSDRKYRQRGYMDTGNASNGQRSDKPRQPGQKVPLDVTGPRLPRMVQAVTASRCYHCATTLPADIDFNGTCPKCGVDLHCCKQCAHFDSSTRFQCRKPIKERVARKDEANLCEFFSARVTVARDTAKPSNMMPGGLSRPPIAAPRSANDARTAFDNLFKK